MVEELEPSPPLPLLYHLTLPPPPILEARVHIELPVQGLYAVHTALVTLETPCKYAQEHGSAK